MKKLVIVDLDGTLFDTSLVNYYAYKTALEEKGFDLDYEYYQKQCNGFYYKEFLPSIVSLDEETIEFIHKRKQELYNQFLDKSTINKHLFNILELLKDTYYIVLATTCSKKNTYDILNYYEKKPLFDLILTQDDIVNKKPNLDIYLKAMEYFKVKPKDTMVFEDSNVCVEAILNLGCSTFKIEKI